MIRPKTEILALAAALLLSLAAPAAEFDIDSGATLLRRLQLCSECGSALLVTRVHPGVLIRCPDCGREQSRLRDQYLITQVYQLCRLCQAPLDAAGHAPGDAVECGNCHTRQILTRDAFLSAVDAGGDGYLPGFPPGSGQKRLLLDSGADNALAAAGISVPPDLPPGLPNRDGPARAQPPAGIAVREPAPGRAWTPEIPVPPPPADAPRPGPPLRTEPPSAPPAIPETPSRPARPPKATLPDAALEVPAVSVDMFGGPKKRPAAALKSDNNNSTLLAKVDGRPIRTESVDVIVGPVVAAMRARAGAGEAGEAARRERELRAAVLDRLIDRELAAAEAERLGFKADPAEVRRKAAELAPRLAGTALGPDREAWLEIAMAAMRRQFGEKPEAVNPAAVRDYYQAHKNEMLAPGGMAVATLIVFRDRTGRADPRDHREIARELSGRLERGERFDALRTAHDEFPPPPGETAPPLRPESYYAEEILAVAGGLRSGAVFGPVFMPGLVLFGKIVDKRPPEPAPFQEVEKDIRRRLGEAEADKHFAEWLDGVRKRTAVEFF